MLLQVFIYFVNFNFLELRTHYHLPNQIYHFQAFNLLQQHEKIEMFCLLELVILFFSVASFLWLAYAESQIIDPLFDCRDLEFYAY